MKFFFLLSLLLSSCSSHQIFKTADFSQELKKNSEILRYVALKVEEDFIDKSSFYQNYSRENLNRENFVTEDLGYRLNELKLKRDHILTEAASIKKVNDDLMMKLDQKTKIQESDPLIKDIDAFAEITKTKGKKLFRDYAAYESASDDFAKFAFLTGSVWKKSTRVRN